MPAKGRKPSLGAEQPKPAGSAMLSPKAWQALAKSLQLSRRQVQIIRAVFDDAKEPAMADNLGISSHTVHTHLERIYRKLGVHDRVELVLAVLREFHRLTKDLSVGLPPLCGRREAGLCPNRTECPPDDNAS